MDDNQKPTGERLATLETQVQSLDTLYRELKTVQACHSDKLEKIAGENISISGKLDTLITSAKDHLDFHAKMGERKINWGNLIVNTLLAFCSIYALVKASNADISNTYARNQAPAAIERMAVNE